MDLVFFVQLVNIYIYIITTLEGSKQTHRPNKNTTKNGEIQPPQQTKGGWTKKGQPQKKIGKRQKKQSCNWRSCKANKV